MVAHATRESKVQLEIVPTARLINLQFSDQITGQRHSVYKDKLLTAVQSKTAIQIFSKDKYSYNQLRAAAKKLHLRLVYAIENEFLFIKPIRVEGETKRIMLFLREPRDMSFLQAQKFEIDLSQEITRLLDLGLVRKTQDKYRCTEKGLATLIE